MTQIQVQERSPSETCPLCRAELGDSPLVTCQGCGTAFHAECDAEFGSGCPIAGCSATQREERREVRRTFAWIPPEERARRESTTPPEERARSESTNSPEERARPESTNPPEERPRPDSTNPPDPRARREPTNPPEQRNRQFQPSPPNQRVGSSLASLLLMAFGLFGAIFCFGYLATERRNLGEAKAVLALCALMLVAGWLIHPERDKP